MSNMPRWYTDLTKAVGYHNSDGELKQMCEVMDIDYEGYEGANHKQKVESIIDISLFRGQLAKLIGYCLGNRPHVQPCDYHRTDWRSIVTQTSSAIRIADPLFQYIGKQRIQLPPPREYRLWYHELSEVLPNYYDQDEFRQLCEAFNYNFAYLSHLERDEQASEIVAYGIDLNLIGKMIHYCKWTRPQVQPLWVHDIPWDDLAERAAAAIKSGNPLNDPIQAARVREKYVASPTIGGKSHFPSRGHRPRKN